MGLGVPTGPRGGIHRARGSNIPTPQYQRHRVTHAGSYLRTDVRFLSQLYFRQLRVSCVLMRHTEPIHDQVFFEERGNRTIPLENLLAPNLGLLPTETLAWK